LASTLNAWIVIAGALSSGTTRFRGVDELLDRGDNREPMFVDHRRRLPVRHGIDQSTGHLFVK
jgi:hypothetical protein